MADTGRTPSPYRALDDLSGGLLCVLTVAAPWMFGCTVDWSLNLMHWGAWILGVALLGKWLVRISMGYVPPRWTRYPGARRWPVRLLFILTIFIVGYVLVSRFNPRYSLSYSNLSGPTLIPAERPPIEWLPSTYDLVQTRVVAADYPALAIFFWAARDWLLGKSRRERRLLEAESAPGQPAGLPARLRFWLWLLCINGLFLGLVSILQRLDHADRLLWVAEPFFTGDPNIIFGPYAYRTNAAQYFNLILPLGVGFWWALRQESQVGAGLGRRGSHPHLMVLPCLIVIGACPIVATSRGGSLVLGGIILATALILGFSRRGSRAAGAVVLAAFGAAVGLGVFVGGAQLSRRFETVITDRMSGRPEIYAVARRMAQDFPWWGSGPGTFKSLYGFYMPDPGAAWAGYAHNDWLEILITFGRFGSALFLAGLAMSVIVKWSGVGERSHQDLAVMAGVAMGGMLLHAVFDFPFQIFSLSFTFILILAAFSTLGAPSSAEG